MADIKLKDGSEVTFDLEAITYSDYRHFAAGALTVDEDNQMLAKVTGLPLDQVGKLTLKEWRQVARAFFRKAAGPLDDPN